MIFRVEKTKDYTVMSNYHLREKNMSLKAKGLLSWMLSNTDEWDYSISGIVQNCKENESSIKSTLKELQDFGYLEIKKQMPASNNGEVIRSRISYEYIVYEKPRQEVEILEVENLHLENLDVEIQDVENPGQINTKEINTKKGILKKEIIRKKDNPDTVQIIVDLYNSHCNKLPKVIGVSDKRRKAIQKLSKKYNSTIITKVFDLANESDFLTGNNDRGWKANIDFLLREDKFINILEGKYNGKTKNMGTFTESGARRVPTFDDKDQEKLEKFQEQLRKDGKRVFF